MPDHPNIDYYDGWEGVGCFKPCARAPFPALLIIMKMLLPGTRTLAVLSVLGYLGMVGGLLLLIISHSIFSPSPVVIGLQAIAVLLMLWARVSFGRRSFHAVSTPTAGPLVTWGPYHYIRHPIYTSVCLFCLPGALAQGSLRSVVTAGVILAAALIRMFCEEKLLRATYPDYFVYSKRTARMMPGVF